MITNPSEYRKQASDSRWKDIFLHLKERGFNPVSPVSLTKAITKPVVVVKYNGSASLTVSSYYDLYTLQVYLPEKQYSLIPEQVDKVKLCMKQLEPMVKQYSSLSAVPLWDDSLKGWYVELSYRNVRAPYKFYNKGVKEVSEKEFKKAIEAINETMDEIKAVLDILTASLNSEKEAREGADTIINLKLEQIDAEIVDILSKLGGEESSDASDT